MSSSSVDTIINSLHNVLSDQKNTQREKHYIAHVRLLSCLQAQNNLEDQSKVLQKITLVKEMALENAARVINSLRISPPLYHRHNMLIHGIHVEGEDHELKVAFKRRNFEMVKMCSNMFNIIKSLLRHLAARKSVLIIYYL
ncbi:MAG: hypothetical protein WCH10_06100 [bacterium]